MNFKPGCCSNCDSPMGKYKEAWILLSNGSKMRVAVCADCYKNFTKDKAENIVKRHGYTNSLKDFSVKEKNLDFHHSIVKSFSFSPTTVAKSAEVNQNFDDAINAIRAAHHSDADGTEIVNADIAAGAAINESKLLFSGSGHRHEGTTDGQNIRAEGLASDTDSFAEVTGGKGAMTSAGIHTFNATSRARAYRSGTQSINSASWTKVQLNAETYDTRSEFASYDFVATVAGFYLVIGNQSYVDIGNDKDMRLAIYKEGSAYAVNQWASHADNNGGNNVMDIVELAATDVVSLYTYHNAGSSKNLEGGATVTWMSVHKLS